MDKVKIDILRFIQESRDHNFFVWWPELDKQGFNSGMVESLISAGLIHGSGTFALTLEGSRVLREYLMIEAATKKDKPVEKYIFDSNVFDDIVEGKLKFESILMYKEKVDLKIYLTHIQNDEIQSCSDEEKRKKLSLFMLKIGPLIIPTESAVYGVSRFGEAKFGAGYMYQEIKEKNVKHIEDALIGETAIRNNLILVTNDKRLKSKVEGLGGLCLSVDSFICRLDKKQD